MLNQQRIRTKGHKRKLDLSYRLRKRYPQSKQWPLLRGRFATWGCLKCSEYGVVSGVTRMRYVVSNSSIHLLYVYNTALRD